METEPGKLLVALPRRPGKFDSDLVEGGPPAVLTENGIVAIYNGKNARSNGDPSLTPGTYAVGQALFDAHDPTKLLARLDEPFFRPEMPYEKTGQYRGWNHVLRGSDLVSWEMVPLLRLRRFVRWSCRLPIG